MKILIIGGCGYIGSYLYQRLKSYFDYEVDTIDLEWFGNPFTDRKNVQCDYGHFLLTPEKYDIIILLAGHSSVKMCGNDGRSTFKNNVNNFTGLIARLLQKGFKGKFIYASSSSLYNNFGGFELNEDFNGYTPVNYYDLSKYTIDNYMLVSAKRLNFEWYGLRFGTVNGGSPNFRHELMINSMTWNAEDKGEVYISNPHIYRPILGLRDLGRAIEYIICKGKHQISGIYNLASFNTTVGQIADVFAKDGCTIHNQGKQGEPYNFQINCSKFMETFNFEFEETIDSIIKSIRFAPYTTFVSNRDKEMIYYG